MKNRIVTIFTLVIELALILVIFFLFLLALIGFLMPVIPGLVFVAFAVAIYLFLLKNENNKVIPPFHHKLLKIRDRFIHLKIIQNIMGLLKKIQKRRKEKIKTEILKHGLILLGFNLALTAALFFALTAAVIISFLASFQDAGLLFVPVFVVFLFAGICAIIWYRFGQILNKVFKKRQILYSGIVVLISVIPLFLLLFFISLIASVGPNTGTPVLIAFIGTVFTTIFAIIFEMPLVSLGVIVSKK